MRKYMDYFSTTGLALAIFLVAGCSGDLSPTGANLNTDSSVENAGILTKHTIAYENAQPATATGSPAYYEPAAHAIDGNLNTGWNSGIHGAANITVTFAAPRTFSGLHVTSGALPAEVQHYTITATRTDNTTDVVSANFDVGGAPNPSGGISSKDFDLGNGFVEYKSVNIAIAGSSGPTASWKAIIEIELIVPFLHNEAPDVSGAIANPGTIWPPNKKMVDIAIDGIVDADGDAVTITIDSITNDETFEADASGVGTSTASVRADRNGNGDGRTYTIAFTADDGEGGLTSGAVTVEVPHDQRGKAKK